MRKILFVCHGNICRSVIAEYLCKHIRPDLYCESMAVSYEEEGNDIYPPAKRCLERHGIPYGKHEARRIQREDYERFDEIYVMDRSNLYLLKRIVEDTEHKVKLLNDYEIEDPWYTGNFDKVYEEIKEGIEKIRK